MKVEQLIKTLIEYQLAYGDIEVTTHDLDRELCKVEEVSFSSYPYDNIYIG